jgi:nifR3 family TIM-barrel protein
MTKELVVPDSRRLQIGPLRLASRYLLAPLAGYTNLPFRLIVRRCGGLGLATTDLVNSRGLLMQNRKTLELVQTCPEDQPLAVQLYGADPGELREAAQFLVARGIPVIDINMGCPVAKVTRGGGGSALLCSRESTLHLVRAVVDAVPVPVTVKMRLGWDDSHWSAPEFARAFEDLGVAAVTIHGRTRAQGFRGLVQLAGIRAVVEAVRRIPVIGNGDVRTPADAERMFAETGCAGIAIGRGALLNPWLFRQLAARDAGVEPGPAPTWHDRVDQLEQHFHLHVQWRGERAASLQFRKVAGWYSKTLRPGRVLHQRLMNISSLADFNETISQLREQARERGIPLGWTAAPIPVPAGPIAHW